MFCAGALAFAVAAGAAVAARAQPLAIEQGFLDVTVHGEAARLDTLIVKRTDLTGPLPVAMITHGVSRSTQERADLTVGTFRGQAIDMALRGYLAVGVIRRGFGRSSAVAAPPGGCHQSRPGYLPALRHAAADIDAVKRLIVRRADADPSRVVGIGVSVGGATMLAWAAERPEGLVAVVNVSGGSGSDAANSNCDAPALVSAFGTFGASVDVPSIWFYAANDTFFGPALVERMHAAFTAHGAKAERHAFDAMGNDGHFIWSMLDGRQAWLAPMDRFLGALGLPGYDAGPAQALAATLDDAGKAAIARYLAAPGQKVFFLSETKNQPSLWRGAGDLEAARRSGLENCQRQAGEPCRIVMENFQAVAR
jgi:dienelactone hydrolase